MKTWIALFSQTGSELKAICKALNIQPKLVYTNNPKYDDVKSFKNIAIGGKKDVSSNTYEAIVKLSGEEDINNVIITLHGWLKIVPNNICEKYVIYNGHPGDIAKYPQLKGKDPQQKAFDLRLKSSGTVIHRVTSIVDGGEIIASNKTDLTSCDTVQHVIDRLKVSSVELWTKNLYNLLK
jgi:folate-dependent phosphoribosylglycinamide formyltransferase PurN